MNDFTTFKDTPVLFYGSEENLQITLKETGEEADLSRPYYAVFEFTLNEVSEEVRIDLVITEPGSADLSSVPVIVFDKFSVELTGLGVTSQKAGIYVYDLKAPVIEEVTVEVSTKPLINLVWLGTVMISAGIMWAAFRRWGPSPFQDLRNRKQKKEAIM
jgi:cytochrome c-type biogenesis protein CcmF